MTPAITESALYSALRAFLLAVAPSATEVVRGNVNRVPMPKAASLIVMTEVRREQLAQTTHAYAPPTDPIPAIGSETVARSTAIHIQLDVYGEAAADTAQVITTLFRDAWGCDFLASRNVAPLYATEPMNMPLVTGESQYVQRRIVTVALQANVEVTVPAEFADNLITTLVEVT
ncbi:LIC_12616 family protein [Novosphingobium colocasiae]|uniref:phage neck terminator protein n=1 Tax=Novosphingobium colocasiae TaxID=1256513 RepID=UPI0035B159C9